ncbi:MAG TPA: hypothetical protein VMJ10_30120 [Kofleriaceae bacterium]|nr:hypothetical protein [Kofleriaceae bacterium]
MLEGAGPAPQLNPAAIANAISMLRGTPPDQLLELAIARVRAALPAGATVAPVQPIKFLHVPIPGAKP